MVLNGVEQVVAKFSLTMDKTYLWNNLLCLILHTENFICLHIIFYKEQNVKGHSLLLKIYVWLDWLLGS